MNADGLGALLVTKRENVHYLTGFTGSAGAVLVASGRPLLVTDFRYKLQAHRETSGTAVVIQKTDFPAAIREAAGRAGVATLWFDESSLTLEGLKKLRKQGLTLKGHRDLVSELRKLKDKQELANIRKAISRAEESFRELKRYIRPGARERDLALMLEMLMREKGARKAAFDTIVASGRNGAMPHAAVTDRRIKKGDLVTIDFGAEADGYFCDITRTICVGRPTVRQREIHALVLNAQSAAIQSVRPGVVCNAVDAALDFWLTTGRFNASFERKLAEFLDVRWAVTTNSGSSANLLALAALTSPKLEEQALKPGDEIITVAAGFPTTVNPAVQYGLVPVFVDVEIPTYNIQADKIEAAITDKTAAIMLAHTLGNPFNLREVMRIAKEHDLWVIEDCCDALGSKYNGLLAGTYGDGLFRSGGSGSRAPGVPSWSSAARVISSSSFCSSVSVEALSSPSVIRMITCLGFLPSATSLSADATTASNSAVPPRDSIWLNPSRSLAMLFVKS